MKNKTIDITAAMIAVIAPVFISVLCAKVALTGIVGMWILVAAFAAGTWIGIIELKQIINN